MKMITVHYELAEEREYRNLRVKLSAGFYEKAALLLIAVQNFNYTGISYSCTPTHHCTNIFQLCSCPTKTLRVRYKINHALYLMYRHDSH
jgi:hypothetical protein